MAKIIVIDDEEALAQLLKEILEIANYDVDISSNPKKGLEMIKENNYDLVCTDVSMEEVSGYDIALFIKENKLKCKVVFLTGWGSAIDDSELEKFGVSKIINKPYKIEEILDEFKKILES